MTREQHQARHALLHASLALLAAAFKADGILKGRRSSSQASIMDLLRWSYERTRDATPGAAAHAARAHHEALDELVADFLIAKRRLLTPTPLDDLVAWSERQAQHADGEHVREPQRGRRKAG